MGAFFKLWKELSVFYVFMKTYIVGLHISCI